MASISLQSKAYFKIMLHCIKHTSSDCYGLLLGKLESSKFIVEDAIPLSHDKIFGPQFEIAIKMIKNFIPESNIIGFYENLMYNQMKEDCEISNQAIYICELIKSNNDIFNPVLFEIYSRDNGNPEKGILEDVIIFKEYTLNDKGGFDFIWDYEESDVEYQKMKTYCEKSLQNDIVDFDDHLENASLDWRNQFIQ